jgi:aspartokinase
MSKHDFEIRPGVNKVEVRHGQAQAHIFDLPNPVMDERLRVLKAVADAAINIDFLKLTTNGLAFIVDESDEKRVKETLDTAGVKSEVWAGVSIVLVHAVNMRDEEGLIAGIVKQAIDSGGKVTHIGDMHDRLLLVVDTESADRMAEQFRKTLIEVAS